MRGRYVKVPLELIPGDQHKRQRRLMNGAFAPKQLERMSQIFTTVAESVSAWDR